MDYLLKIPTDLKEPNELFNSFLLSIDNTDKLKNMRALEIGIGIGNKSIPLSKKFKSYYGIEQDKLVYNKFLEICNENKCNIIAYNLDYYTFIEKTNKLFDIIIAINVIYFFDLDLFFEKSLKILNLKKTYLLIQNPKARPYGWGLPHFNKNSDSFNETKWIKFRTKLTNVDKYLISSKYFIKKESSDIYNIYLLFVIQ